MIFGKRWVWAVVLLLPLTAFGQSLEVTADRVNLRAEPSTDGSRIGQLTRNQVVTEKSREAGWVEVVTGAGEQGWVYGSLLAPVHDAEAAFVEFRKQFDHRNELARSLTGETFFHGAEDKGDGSVEVTASDVWLSQPREGRDDNLRVIMEMWQQVHPQGLPLEVVIVDREGERHMTLSR